MIEQAKSTYSPLRKALQKQTKTIENQKKEQVKPLKFLESSNKQLPAIKDSISNESLNSEIIYNIKRIEKEEEKAGRSKMVYKGYYKTYDFRKFKTRRDFGNDI